MKDLLVTLVLILFWCTGGAQENSRFTKTKEWDLKTGYTYQKQHSAELGIARTNYGVNGYHPYFMETSAGAEFLFGEDFILGPKMAFRLSGGQAMGINLIAYTDFTNTEVVFRPDIGVGMYSFALVYGYNFRLNKAGLNMNRHLFSLIFYIGKGINKAF